MHAHKQSYFRFHLALWFTHLLLNHDSYLEFISKAKILQINALFCHVRHWQTTALIQIINLIGLNQAAHHFIHWLWFLSSMFSRSLTILIHCIHTVPFFSLHDQYSTPPWLTRDHVIWREPHSRVCPPFHPSLYSHSMITHFDWPTRASAQFLPLNPSCDGSSLYITHPPIHSSISDS